MVSTRFFGLVSTVLLVVGALLVGDAFHAALVAGTATLTEAGTVLKIALGGVLILLGYRARQPVVEEQRRRRREREAARAERPDADAVAGPGREEESGFDPEMSPLGDAQPGERVGDPDPDPDDATRSDEP